VVPYSGRVTGGADSCAQGRGRSLAEPAFPHDDGTADPRVRELLAAVSEGHVPPIDAARALRSARLLATVVAVADDVTAGGSDTSSHMAVVSMVNDRGEKGLLAFTGVDSLAAWDPAARPVPTLGTAAARAAIDDGAEAVVIDVAGPHRTVLAGAALTVLADELDLERVTALVQAALAPITADGWADASVLDVRGTGAAADVLVVVTSAGGGHPDGRRLEVLAQQAAQILASRPDIQRRVLGGIGVTAG